MYTYKTLHYPSRGLIYPDHQCSCRAKTTKKGVSDWSRGLWTLGDILVGLAGSNA